MGVETKVNDSDTQLEKTREKEILSDLDFDTLSDKISEKTLRAIKEMGFTKMTKIQAKALPIINNMHDVFCHAKTGSGKTLIYLIRAIEFVSICKFKPRNGTGALILLPTRELAIQTFGILKKLIKYHSQTIGLAVGGSNRKQEAYKLEKGVNILVGTPGRVLDHMKNTRFYHYACIFCLIIDEADRILDVGFEKEMREIVERMPVPVGQQKLMFSATQSKEMKKLHEIVFKTRPPVYVALEDIKKEPTVENLKQGFMLVSSEKMFLTLHRFLSDMLVEQKVMVFFSSCKAVEFYTKVYNFVFNINVICIHGQMKADARDRMLRKFCREPKGILFCTDIMARGLDIPEVDWIIQYDPPNDPKEYIHRVGRTARGEGSSGYAILFLRPDEKPFREYIHKARVPMHRFTFVEDRSESECKQQQEMIEQVIGQNYYLRSLAGEAYDSYLRAYKSHKLKSIFDFEKLDLSMVAKAFGLKKIPEKGEEIAKRKRKLEKDDHFNRAFKRKFLKNGNGKKLDKFEKNGGENQKIGFMNYNKNKQENKNNKHITFDDD